MPPKTACSAACEIPQEATVGRVLAEGAAGEPSSERVRPSVRPSETSPTKGTAPEPPWPVVQWRDGEARDGFRNSPPTHHVVSSLDACHSRSRQMSFSITAVDRDGDRRKRDYEEPLTVERQAAPHQRKYETDHHNKNEPPDQPTGAGHSLRQQSESRSHG